jgi:hypothetical protein
VRGALHADETAGRSCAVAPIGAATRINNGAAEAHLATGFFQVNVNGGSE